jgi:hypothetical protein
VHPNYTPLSEQWHIERQKYLSGSRYTELLGFMGLHRQLLAIDKYREGRGGEQVVTPAMQHGLDNETKALDKLFTILHSLNIPFQYMPSQSFFVNYTSPSDVTRVISTNDGTINCGGPLTQFGRMPVECKCPFTDKSAKRKGVAPHYIAQLNLEMTSLNASHALYFMYHENVCRLYIIRYSQCLTHYLLQFARLIDSQCPNDALITFSARIRALCYAMSKNYVVFTFEQ